MTSFPSRCADYLCRQSQPQPHLKYHPHLQSILDRACCNPLKKRFKKEKKSCKNGHMRRQPDIRGELQEPKQVCRVAGSFSGRLRLQDATRRRRQRTPLRAVLLRPCLQRHGADQPARSRVPRVVRALLRRRSGTRATGCGEPQQLQPARHVPDRRRQGAGRLGGGLRQRQRRCPAIVEHELYEHLGDGFCFNLGFNLDFCS